MKRWNKILLVVLAFAVAIPMLATLVPMEASAASESTHEVYQNMLDFEDATVGETLSADYMNTKMWGGFTATTPSNVDTPFGRKTERFQIASETVDGVTNKYIEPVDSDVYQMPTLYDQTGITWRQPYEVSFKIKGETGNTGGPNSESGYKYGALIAVSSAANATSNRASLVYVYGMRIGWENQGKVASAIATLAAGQWHEVRAYINPLTGKINLRIEQLTFDENNTLMTVGAKGMVSGGGKVISSTTTISDLVTKAEANPTAGVVSLGRFYAGAQDFCYDDIRLASCINEHIDFTGAVINDIPETTTVQTLTDYLNANDGTLTSGISQFTDSAGTDCYGLVQDGDNWVMRQDIASTAKADADTAGLNFKDTTNLTNQDTVTITFDFRRNADKMPGGYNTVRTTGGTTMGPLTFRDGKYITTNANGYATFRKTETGYVQGTIDKDKWYSFKVELDMPNTAMKVWMKEGTTDGPSTADWEPIYYLINGTDNNEVYVKDTNPYVSCSTAISKTYSLADYEAKMTTDASLKWYNGSSAAFGSTPQLWILHGTNDAWGNGSNADLDNLTIVTADGGLDVSFDFTPEITVTPAVSANTDWWENDTFQNADAKKGGAKLSDFQVVDAPADATTYGSVIQPTGTLGSFCFDDTKDLLTNYVFDVSYDFYMTQQPSSNMLMLKLWAPYTATDSSADAIMNTLVLEDSIFKIFDSTASSSRKALDVATAANINIWYNIRTRFDFISGYYWVYINDALVHTQYIPEVYPDLNLEAFHSIHFGIHSHWGSSVKAYHYLDNIKVQTVGLAAFENKSAELIGVQQSKNSNAIRVLAGVDSLNYGNVGFTFELLAEDGTGWVKVYDRMTNTVYTQITADGETVNAEDQGSKYFIMAVISDINTDGILCIRPYTTKNYVRNYGEEAIYMLKVNDGSLLMQPTTISTTTSSSDYVVYAEEGYENALETFTTYNATPNASDTGEYRLGGQMKTTNIPIGATTDSARTGEKAMTISGIAPHSSGAFSARIKLNNLMPFDIASYENYDVKISAYVKLEDLVDPSKDVSMRLGLMSEYTNTELTYKTTAVSGGQWTLIEYEGRISADLLTKIGDGYPARVFLGLGSASSHAGTIHVDDFKVELKPSVGVSLPSIFADGMVLQRNKPVNVWGFDGLEGDSIVATVTNSSGATLATASATVDSNGEFTVTLPAMAGGTDNTLTVTNETVGSSVSYSNVGIGEVWYCSGQSNMELSMARAHNIEEIVADASNRDIRSFKMSISAKYTLQKDVSGGKWKQVTTDNVTDVSAIAYLTAYQLQKELGVPVAIVESYNGGSSANAWLSYDKVFASDRAEIYDNEDWIPKNADGSVMTVNSGGLEGKTMYEDYDYYWQVGTANEGTLRAGEHGNIGNRFAPTGLYNGMQGPLAGFTMGGVLWYQGEARTNSLRPEEYNYVLYDLVEQWREDFCDDDLPVVIFQLAPYSSDYYNLLRQTQLDTAKRLDNVYAITTAYEGAVYSAASGGYCLDLDRSMSNGWGNAIHPGTKVPVAERAAYAILAGEYGLGDTYGAYLNPEYQSMTVAGNVATLTFANANGLKVRDGDEALTGFLAYAADGTALTVTSVAIDGDTVVVTTEEGTSPAKITYAFHNSATKREVSYSSLATNDGYDPQYIVTMSGNLENAKGQPTIPFMATLSDVSIYDASVKSGKLNVEIRELGHLESTYKVVVDVNGTETEYTASFATAGNFVISDVTVNAGDSVTVTLKTADGTTVATKTLSVE